VDIKEGANGAEVARTPAGDWGVGQGDTGPPRGSLPPMMVTTDHNALTHQSSPRGSLGSWRRFLTIAFIAPAMLGLLLCSTGCHDEGCDDSDGCPSIDDEASAGDYRIELDPTAGMVAYQAGGHLEAGSLLGAEVVMAAEGGDYSASSPFRATIRRLRLSLADLVITTTGGDDVVIEGPEVSFEGPIEIQNEGAGFWIPADTLVQTCASVRGRRQFGKSPLAEPGHLDVYFTAPQSFTLDISFDLVVHAENDECSEFRVETSVFASGLTPFEVEGLATILEPGVHRGQLSPEAVPVITVGGVVESGDRGSATGPGARQRKRSWLG